MPEKPLTDTELRQKLIDLGLDVGPITDSTRKLYERKLNNLLNSKTQETKKNRRRSAPLHPVHKAVSPNASLIGFSSEESDIDASTLEGRRRRRRTLPPTPVDFSLNSRDSGSIPSTSTPPEFKMPYPKKSPKSHDNGALNTEKRPSLRSPKPVSNHSAFDIDSSDSDLDFDKRLSTNSKSRRSLGSSRSDTSITTSTPLNVTLRNRTSSRTGANKSASTSSFTSSVVTQRATTSQQVNGMSQQVKETDQDLEWEFTGDETTTWWQHIPHLLLIVVIIFFAIVGLLYIAVRQNDHTSSLATNGFSHLICKGFSTENCVPKEHFELAMLASRHLYHILSEHAGLHECDPVKYPMRSLKIPVVKRTLFDIQDIRDENLVDQVFESCIFLMKSNPDWGLTVLENEMSEPFGIESQVAAKHVMCRLKQAFERVFKQLFFVLTVILGGFGCFIFVKQAQQKKRIFEQQLFELVGKIVDVLQRNQENAVSEKESFLPIVHVRDMLIPLKERNNKEMQKLWDAAVNFLESNESRIRKERQRIAGEDFMVWRWLQPASPYPSSGSSTSPDTRMSKVWQGQAFGATGKGGNVLPFSPTPCLKIRNMFDSDVEFGTDWPQYIRNAILEKCESCNGILHIHVDSLSKEGCVYVKCNALESAGQAYRSLHGWWFDGNLITVKYLRLERYHERFPDSRCAVTPLKPSNSLRLSLRPPHSS